MSAHADRFLEYVTTFLPEVLSEEQTSEDQSLWSEATHQLSVAHPRTAFENIAAYFALIREADNRYWLTDKETKYFANLAYYHQYEGNWAVLQILLEHSSNFQELEAVALELLGAHAFYGNLVKMAQRFRLTLQLRPRKQLGRVKKPVRRRGYRDKGQQSLLTPGVNYGREESCVPKIDRRNLIQHPLLRSDYEPSNLEGVCTANLILSELQRLKDEAQQRKEELYYEQSINRSNCSNDQPGSQSASQQDREQPPDSEESCCKTSQTGHRDPESNQGSSKANFD